MLTRKVRMLGKSDGGSAFRAVLAGHRPSQEFGGPPHRTPGFLVSGVVRGGTCATAVSSFSGRTALGVGGGPARRRTPAVDSYPV